MKHTSSKLSYILLPSLLLILACERAPEGDVAADRQAIDALYKQRDDALARRDAAAVAMLVTEDATILPPNSPTVVGREAIQAFAQGFFDSGLRDIKDSSVKFHVSGDVAYDVGEYKLTMQPEGDEPMTNKGRFVRVFKRQNGTWKLDVEIFNASMPPPEPMPEMPEAMPQQ